jgi:L-2-hydroxyglutarate oxidase
MSYDIVIVGGGIVGLATGMKIQAKRPDLKIAILEKEDQLAKHQTGNNSGVIHSGLYYKPGSLKAINCISGYHELINFCKEEKIPFEITGKVVVATRESQKPLIKTLLERGLQNGLTGTREISLEELKAYEPHCAGVAALHVPQTGIVDYYQVALAFGRKIIQGGGEIFLNHKVLKISLKEGVNHIETSNKTFQSKLVINCAGLYSDKVAQMGESEPIDVKIIPFRGEYYKLRKDREYLVRNLIYPVPDPNFPFLGVHFTRMKKGGV